ncbi:MAG: DUF1501 domain-containing protein [Verrucomicrobiales bacterium]|nr:DUF1501 domain-containing protein [Verrucomicrobiales bacterium]
MQTRRHALQSTVHGFGYLALAGLLRKTAPAASAAQSSPFAPKRPHFPARAKRVIFLCMKGGPSHMDMFDHKPKLAEVDGKALGDNEKIKMLGSLWDFKQHGQDGMWFSELLPNLATRADDLCMLHGMNSENPEHAQALDFLHTGSFQFVRPSMGSWVLYGLGTENQDLPGFVSVNPPHVLGGAKYYGSAFLPAAYQGTPVGQYQKNLKDAKLSNISHPRLSREHQRKRLDLAQVLNRETADRLPENRDEIEGVIESFELAFRMQKALPEVMDIAGENPKTLEMYGIGASGSDSFGRQCLLARRMAERGVRFIQVNDGDWDHHGGLAANMPKACARIDKPIAGLIEDLKQRGLFDDTLIVWGGEFGRTPDDGTRDGRGHNADGFTMFLAGGGVKRGFKYGATDEYGRKAVEGKIHIHDLHATMLHLLGLDHENLTYNWAGRDFRLTDVHGHVVKDILA